jgi:hypothetical protein
MRNVKFPLSQKRLQVFSAANVYFFCLTAFSASNTRFSPHVLQRCFQVSPKLLGFGEACPGVLKVSCRGVALWALRNLATRRINDLGLTTAAQTMIL